MDTREYLAAHLGTIKLTEKKCESLRIELKKWQDRVELAVNKGAGDLAEQARMQAERIQEDILKLETEIVELQSEAERLRKVIPAEDARKRSIDPDLLEQELLMATGHMPGDEDKAALEKEFKELAKENEAQASLEALKKKMNENTGEDSK